MKLTTSASILILTGVALSSPPALSQGAAGMGAPGAMAPQPHMTPPPQGSPGGPNGTTVYYGNVYGDAKNDTKTGIAGPRQQPSKAPLPSGYAYDANGRIVFVGTGGANGNGGARSDLSGTWNVAPGIER